MARIRTIKPEFFTSEDVSSLPLRARLTWIGLWTQCDDHGRTKDHPRLIKAALWPLDDVTLAQIEDDLVTLAEAKRIVRYERDGKAYLAVVNWHHHQVVNRPSRTRHPAPPVLLSSPVPGTHGYCEVCSLDAHDLSTADSVRVPGALTLGREGNGKEGNARASTLPGPSRASPDPKPPRKCPAHVNDPNPPNCGACKDARHAYDEWVRTRPTPTPSTPMCPLHPDQPTGSQDCPACTQAATPPPDLRALRGAP